MTSIALQDFSSRVTSAKRNSGHDLTQMTVTLYQLYPAGALLFYTHALDYYTQPWYHSWVKTVAEMSSRTIDSSPFGFT